jgi:hypothetical protein
VQADSAALGGLAFLLQGWGATVLSFDNLCAARIGLASCQGSNADCSLALKPDGVVASRRHSPSYDSSSRLASGLDGGAIKRHLSPDTTLVGGATAGTPCPDLLIVDDSLEADATAIEAIAWVRHHFNQPIPAIVVAGSDWPLPTDGESDMGLHRLTRPVAPSKLRALVAFKLGLPPKPGWGAQTAGSEFEIVDQAGLSEASSPQRDQGAS